ncbi:FkbM family methyltransferase [Alsobacter sp. R-9]
MLKFIARNALETLGSLPGAMWAIERCALAPARFKTPEFQRALARMTRSRRWSGRLVETNLGYDLSIRALIPAEKTDLLFGRPENNLAERGTMALARVLAQGCSAFVDVGANEGLFTFAAAEVLGRGRSNLVHAFEPDPILFQRLSDNIRRNGLDVQLIQAAASDKTERQVFYRNISDDSSGSLTTYFADKHETDQITVDALALSHYLDEKNITDACVKIDVEGAGVAAWCGLAPAAGRIGSVIIEIIGPETEAQLPYRIIQETGWNAFYIRDYELVPSRLGEFDYVAPFYNWLFTSLSLDVLRKRIKNSPLKIIR